MKLRYRRGIAIAVLFAVGLAIALMARLYFRYVSQQIYEECAEHLVEVYSQVNRSFVSFLEEKWGNLDDWMHQIRLGDEEDILTFLRGRREKWNFSEFYFLSSDGRGFTPEGAEERFGLERAGGTLFSRRENAMFTETLSSGQAVTLFAVPAGHGSCRGFDYDAIAVSYSNADIVASLNTDAFSGQSMCLVVHTDGSVLLSTQPSGSAFGNYLSYLGAGSDLGEEGLAALRRDWEDGASGVVRCKIGGVRHYISYQSVGYESCVLLGVVPESAASASMLEIQKATVDFLVKMSLLLGALIVVMIVVTYRRKAKKSVLELLYRERMFDMLSNNVDDVFLMLDSRTLRVDYLSPNVERLLGLTKEGILENIRQLEDVSTGEGGVTAETLKDIPIHGSRSWEREHIHRSTGERRWFYETVYREEIRGVEKYVVVMSDRTRERNMSRNLEEALAAAKSANEAKSHFLSNMSHDIRTPMNAIVGFAVLLARDAGNEEKVREYTRKISASSQHLLSLINDVLDMSKIESGKTSLNVAVFHLPELMEELHTILLPQARAKGQSFELRTKGRPAERLLGDKLRLNQILINLLSNSIKYTQEGGEITCTVEELPQPSPQFSKLRFVVEDNGMGMSEEFVRIVFEPFAREATSTISGIQGTGLGMAITKNLVELMGGVISVTSRQGEGSVFTVELTFARPEQGSGGEDFWRSHGITRMLAVDDEEEICLDVQAMMRGTGVDVSYETRRTAGVEAAVRAHGNGEGFHVILMDWIMPGLSGVETVRRLRESVGTDTPILVMTSYDWTEIEDEAREAGVDAFMPKPFFLSTFQQALEGLYSKREREEAPPDLENALRGLHLLVAEDNELNAEILFEMMEMEGAKCELAVNGREAAEMFERSEPGYYDMILMDVQMPVMNGYEATREIRACGHPRAGSIPIVAMTANAFAEDVRNALDAGMNGHLTKPIDMAAVKTLLGRLRGGYAAPFTAAPDPKKDGGGAGI